MSAAAAAAGGGVRGAPASKTASDLEAVSPLAAVCISALRGWCCSLDDFQAAFAAAAEDVRCGWVGVCEDGVQWMCISSLEMPRPSPELHMST